MTRLQARAKMVSMVKERYEMLCHNLMCYSLTLNMDRPKEGYSIEYAHALNEVEECEQMMKHYRIERY